MESPAAGTDVRRFDGELYGLRPQAGALLGVRDLIIVDTPDALPAADRSRAQQVGEMVKLLEKNAREELL